MSCRNEQLSGCLCSFNKVHGSASEIGVYAQNYIDALFEAQSEYMSNGPVRAPMFSVGVLGGGLNRRVQVARQRPALYCTQLLL